MRRVPYSAELLASLQGLSGLRTLLLSHRQSAKMGFEAMCQLTGLRKLGVGVLGGTKGDLRLQMSRLKQLTALTYEFGKVVSLKSQVGKH
jgi:hypothetical protein